MGFFSWIARFFGGSGEGGTHSGGRERVPQGAMSGPAAEEAGREIFARANSFYETWEKKVDEYATAQQNGASSFALEQLNAEIKTCERKFKFEQSKLRDFRESTELNEQAKELRERVQWLTGGEVDPGKDAAQELHIARRMRDREREKAELDQELMSELDQEQEQRHAAGEGPVLEPDDDLGLDNREGPEKHPEDS